MPLQPATRSSRRGLRIAWIVILLLVVGVAAAAILSSSQKTAAGRLVAELQLRAAIGMRELGMSAALAGVEPTLAAGGPHECAAAVVLAAELRGAKAARARLPGYEAAIGAAGQPAEDMANDLLAATVLARLYADRDVAERADAMPPASRERLIDRLGWIGELALHPAGTENTAARADLLAAGKRTALANLGVFVLGGLGVLLGAVILIVGLVKLRVGTLSAMYQPEDGPAGAFAETFAIWLAAFVAISTGVQLLLGEKRGPLLLAAIGAAQLLSLVTLAWLTRRGLAWPAIRQRLGLHTGTGFFREIAAGVVAYVGMLPLVAIGVILTLLVQALGAAPATHPVAELLREGPAVVIAVIVVGAVLAPIVEEILFRGVLYHHLRSATRKRGPVVSVLLSAGLSGVLFASIHPQGLAGIPVLATVGVGLALTREWRGSIVAPIATHACVNSVTFVISIYAL